MGTSVYLGGKLPCVSVALVFMFATIVFIVATQSIPLDCLALVARRLVYRTVINGNTILGRSPASGHCTNRRFKHMSSLSVKKG